MTFAPAPFEKGRTIGAPALLYGICFGLRNAVSQHSRDDFEIKCVSTSRNHKRAKLLDLAGFKCARLVVQCL